MEDVCRVCTTSDVDLMDIFSADGDDKYCLAEMLIECVDCDLHPNDLFPKKICRCCIIETRNAFKFKRRYERSHQQFCQLLDMKDNLVPNGSWVIHEVPGEDKSCLPVTQEKQNVIENNTDNDDNAAEGNDIDTHPEDYEIILPADDSELTELDLLDSFKYEKQEDDEEEEARVFDEERDKKTGEDSADNNLFVSLCASDGFLEENECDSDEESVTFMCAICQMKYNNKLQLMLHTLNHNSKENPEMCPFCRKTFSCRSSLRRHIYMHAEKGQYRCPKCPKTFVQMVYLQKHSRVHSGDRRYTCSQCRKGFTQRNHLTKHMTVHSSSRPFVCPHCPKSFASTEERAKHAKIHDVVKKFVCSLCPKGFSRRILLEKHTERHSKTAAFKCDNCASPFKTLDQLEEHNSISCPILRHSSKLL